MSLKTIITCFILILSICSCSIQAPEYRGYDGIKLGAPEGKNIYLSTGIKVFNPNWFGVRIKPSHLDFYIDDLEVGKLFLEKKIKMSPKRESDLQMLLRAEIVDGGLITLLKAGTRETVDVHIKGKMKGGVFIFNKKILIDTTIQIQGRKLNSGFQMGK